MATLEDIDCNCNNCINMIRDGLKRKQSLELHEKWQLDYYNLIKGKASEIDAAKMRFEFNSGEATIHYGNCVKFNKEVSFVPGVCQLDTQDCFNNRR